MTSVNKPRGIIIICTRETVPKPYVYHIKGLAVSTLNTTCFLQSSSTLFTSWLYTNTRTRTKYVKTLMYSSLRVSLNNRQVGPGISKPCVLSGLGVHVVSGLVRVWTECRTSVLVDSSRSCRFGLDWMFVCFQLFINNKIR